MLGFSGRSKNDSYVRGSEKGMDRWTDITRALF